MGRVEMKKITKTFYVNSVHLDRIKDETRVQACGIDFYTQEGVERNNVRNPVPVEITFSVPEKTVTISEGDFDSIVLGPWREFLVHNETHRVMVNSMKQKLFGESHD